MEKELNLLKKQISQGDSKAFKQLHEQVTPYLSNFAEVYVKSPMIADEMVSEVMAKIWVNRKNISSIDNLKSYLFRAVKNESIKYLEREKGRPFIQLDVLYENGQYISSSLNPHDQLTLKELESVLEQSISQLSPQCQEVFRLVKNSGLKYKEAADILGISVNTVENQMSKALKHVRKYIALYLSEQPKKNNTQKEALVVHLAILFNFLNFF